MNNTQEDKAVNEEISGAHPSGANLTEPATMSLEEVAERLLTMEGAVQRLIAIVAVALPHTDHQLYVMSTEWGRIISEIKRDYAKTPK